MDNENYDPQMDPEYQAWLDSRRAQADNETRHHESNHQQQHSLRPPQSTGHYVPNQGRREFTPQRTDKNGQGWDKSVQQGDVFATLQRSYKGKDGKMWFNGQVRLVVKDYKGNQFVSLENWKVHDDDVKRDAAAQRHEWKGAANIQIKELKEISDAFAALAQRLDGGGTR